MGLGVEKCGFCEEEFEKKRKLHKFCTAKCYWAHWEQTHPRVKAAEPTPKRREAQLAQARATRKWKRDAEAFLCGLDPAALIARHGDIISLGISF